MTYEEAIFNQKYAKFLVETDNELNSDDEPVDTIFIDMAIQALEKQIPKKPINVETTDNEHICILCPNCHRTEYIKNEPLNTYCGFCGQAIDWSEADENN